MFYYRLCARLCVLSSTIVCAVIALYLFFSTVSDPGGVLFCFSIMLASFISTFILTVQIGDNISSARKGLYYTTHLFIMLSALTYTAGTIMWILDIAHKVNTTTLQYAWGVIGVSGIICIVTTLILRNKYEYTRGYMTQPILKKNIQR